MTFILRLPFTSLLSSIYIANCACDSIIIICIPQSILNDNIVSAADNLGLQMCDSDQSVSTVCQGSIMQYNCTASRILRWSGTALSGQCMGENITVDLYDFERTSQCGQFNATSMNTTEGSNTAVLLSVIRFRVSDLVGRTLRCTIERDQYPVDICLSKFIIKMSCVSSDE